jgi:putative polyhydroxyalkanoate system protein
MSEINYVRPHALTVAQAKKVAQKTADDLAAEYSLASEWEGDTLHFRRAGVDGHMKVTAAEIRLHVQLGFLLRPFKSKFEQHIERHLDELLAAARPAKAATRAAGKSSTKPAAKPAAKSAAQSAANRPKRRPA